MKTIIVGMSGGVDSSVSALLLKQQGYRVIGLFMKNWEEKDQAGQCTSAADYEDVMRVCEAIDIPYYGVNFVKEYWDHVFSQVLEDFQRGITPNPDVLCNREIKFKMLLDKALELGGDCLATGHYCQLRTTSTGDTQLLRGADSNKDQSYFLYMVGEQALKKAAFPIGGMTKTEVRAIAKKYNLPTAEKKDSTGVCFIGERNFKEFISQFIPKNPGNFEDLSGKRLGRHDGVNFYTIGQRKGLGIGGAGEAWFVVAKDLDRNVVILAQGEGHPALLKKDVVVQGLHWVSDKGMPELPYRCTGKLRYRQVDQPCWIQKAEGGCLFVEFDEPQRAVTPGQSLVFYQGDVCLGGGVIAQIEQTPK